MAYPDGGGLTGNSPGGFWLRILLLLGALASLIMLRGSCSSGVAGVFETIAPPPKSAPSAPSGPGIQFSPDLFPGAPGSQGASAPASAPLSAPSPSPSS